MRQLNFLKVFVGVLIVLQQTNGFAQDRQDPYQALSPYNAASSVQKINSTVNPSTGVANVHIPLFDFKTNDQTIPIGLVYQASGIKAGDTDKNGFGAGWNMTGGGKVTRIVRGRPDGGSPSWNAAFNSLSYGGPGNNDYESDLYYFETPTVSGMFVFDVNFKAYTIPYQNVRIEWGLDQSSQSRYFTIKDSQGNTFTFGYYDNAKDEAKVYVKRGNQAETNPYTYISTWHLEQIVSSKGEVINYEYSSQNDITETIDLVEHQYDASSSYLGPYTYSSAYTVRTRIVTRSPKIIKKIAWGDKKSVWFSTSNYLINSVSLYGSNKPDVYKNSFYFIYKNATDNYRKTLLSEIYMGSQKTNHYQLNYFGDYTPYNRLDWWGYFNNKYNPLPAQGSTTEYRPDKDPVLEHARTYSLSSVVFPEGGSKEFIYELNDYHNSAGIDKTTGGLRIKELRTISNSGDIQSVKYEYKTPEGYSSGVAFAETIKSWFWDTDGSNRKFKFFYERALNDLFDINGRNVMYSTVREINADGTSIWYEYTTANDEFARDTPSTIKDYNNCPNLSIRQERIYDNTRPFPDGNADFPNNTAFWKRGLLKKKTALDQLGDPITTESYHYEFAPVVATVKGFQYYWCYAYREYKHSNGTDTAYPQCYIWCQYQWQSQPVYLKKMEVLKGPLNQLRTFEYAFNTQYMVPVIEKETDCEGNVLTKYTKYPFSYNISGAQSTYNSTPYALQTLKQNGIVVPVETSIYKNGKLVNAELIEYVPQFFYVTPYRSFIVPGKYYKLNPEALSTAFQEYNGYTFDSRYELETYFHSYDRDGRLVCIVSKGTIQSYIYDEKSHMVIAEVSNAVNRDSPVDETGAANIQNQLFYTSFENAGRDVIWYGEKSKSGFRIHQGAYNVKVDYLAAGKYTLSYWQSHNNGNTWSRITRTINHSGGAFSTNIGSGSAFLDEVRLLPEGARMKTYAYLPFGEILSETDVNEKTVQYEYEPYSGRLMRILNDRWEVLTEYEYNILMR